MQLTISALLIIAGIIHLLPLSGVLSAARLTALYTLEFRDPNLEILMRHRAVLFGLLGLFLIYAAIQPSIQPLAFIAGFVSALSFMGLAWSVGGYNGAVRKVVVADIVAVTSLGIATVLYLIVHSQN